MKISALTLDPTWFPQESSGKVQSGFRLPTTLSRPWGQYMNPLDHCCRCLFTARVPATQELMGLMDRFQSTGPPKVPLTHIQGFEGSPAARRGSSCWNRRGVRGLLPGLWWLFGWKRSLCIPYLWVDLAFSQLGGGLAEVFRPAEGSTVSGRGLPCHPQLLR